ncbi:MAG: hypothetical protein K6G48_01685 [Acholeplasmatales bacterium]|nr:hypothetical protein [Acholeplasmatales bacterium]
MDKESISRLGLDYINGIDSENSDEIYDPTTNNHNGYVINNGGMERDNIDVKTIIAMHMDIQTFLDYVIELCLLKMLMHLF